MCDIKHPHPIRLIETAAVAKLAKRTKRKRNTCESATATKTICRRQTDPAKLLCGCIEQKNFNFVDALMFYESGSVQIPFESVQQLATVLVPLCSSNTIPTRQLLSLVDHAIIVRQTWQQLEGLRIASFTKANSDQYLELVKNGQLRLQFDMAIPVVSSSSAAPTVLLTHLLETVGESQACVDLIKSRLLPFQYLSEDRRAILRTVMVRRLRNDVKDRGYRRLFNSLDMHIFRLYHGLPPIQTTGRLCEVVRGFVEDRTRRPGAPGIISVYTGSLENIPGSELDLTCSDYLTSAIHAWIALHPHDDINCWILPASALDRQLRWYAISLAMDAGYSIISQWNLDDLFHTYSSEPKLFSVLTADINYMTGPVFVSICHQLQTHGAKNSGTQISVTALDTERVLNADLEIVTAYLSLFPSGVVKVLNNVLLGDRKLAYASRAEEILRIAGPLLFPGAVQTLARCANILHLNRLPDMVPAPRFYQFKTTSSVLARMITDTKSRLFRNVVNMNAREATDWNVRYARDPLNSTFTLTYITPRRLPPLLDLYMFPPRTLLASVSTGGGTKLTISRQTPWDLRMLDIPAQQWLNGAPFAFVDELGDGTGVTRDVIACFYEFLIRTGALVTINGYLTPSTSVDATAASTRYLQLTIWGHMLAYEFLSGRCAAYAINPLVFYAIRERLAAGYDAEEITLGAADIERCYRQTNPVEHKSVVVRAREIGVAAVEAELTIDVRTTTPTTTTTATAHGDEQELLSYMSRAVSATGLSAIANGFAYVCKLPLSVEQLIDLTCPRAISASQLMGCCRHDQRTKTTIDTLNTAFTDTERLQFVTFVTGHASLPPGGLTIPINVIASALSSGARGRLPEARTCISQLTVPEYASPELLVSSMRTAMNASGNQFGFI